MKESDFPSRAEYLQALAGLVPVVYEESAKKEGWRVGSQSEGIKLENDGAAWAKYFFPNFFGRPYTEYQKDFWKWIDTIEPGQRYRPRVECEPRGVGKSTNAEAAVAKLVATKKRRMVGYVSLEDTKATKHFESIKSMFESERFLEAYPHCRPKIQKLRDIAAQWSRDAIVTADGAMIVPLSLLGSSRGWKSSEGERFDLIILDDIDKLGQSPDLVKKLIDMLKGEILAAGTDQTLVIMPQNLIYRDSICAQVLDQRADILTDRIFCGPYPLLKWYEAEKVDVDGDDTGAKKWVITSGEAFDPAIGLDYAESLLNTFGKALFDRECQQIVNVVEDDKDFREWDERYHLITKSEFRRTMEDRGERVWNEHRECLQIPFRWNVGLGFDWGTTKGHPSAVVFVARPPENSAFADCHFVFAEVIKPKFPLDAFEEIELVSPGRMATAIQNKLKEWNVNDSQVTIKRMSHEASAALNTMALDLPSEIQMFWGKWKAQKGSGVAQIQNLLELDKAQDHPFRVYPKGHPEEGRPLRGRPRIYFIVDDAQGDLWSDGVGLFITGAKDAGGFARARFEMPLYSFRNSGRNKIDDDFVDAFRGLMNIFGAQSGKLTAAEKIYASLPVDLQEPNIKTTEQRMAQQIRLEKEIEKVNEKRNSEEWEFSR